MKIYCCVSLCDWGKFPIKYNIYCTVLLYFWLILRGTIKYIVHRSIFPLAPKACTLKKNEGANSYFLLEVPGKNLNYTFLQPTEMPRRSRFWLLYVAFSTGGCCLSGNKPHDIYLYYF